jgi:hypothetical protein
MRQEEGMRAVQFPEDHSVGKLIRVVRHGADEAWEDIAEVRGSLTLPAGDGLVLELDNTEALSPLDALPPDALFGLVLWKLFTLRDEELRHVGRLTGLRRLWLSDAWAITDTGIAHLAGLVHLEDLDLTETAVTDRGLRSLGALANLRRLILWGTRVGDIGAEHLGNLNHLEELDLRHTAISDRSIANLAALKGLAELDIAGTGITPQGVEALQGALPHCTIVTS